MMLQRPARVIARVRGSLARVLDLQSGPRASGLAQAKSFRFGAVLQGIVLASAALFSLGGVLLSTDVDAAAVCAAPGRDTIPTSGIINSYWGGASATNGGTNATITLGNQRTGTSNTPYGVSAVASTGISAGDLLIVMQMQGPTAGTYEYVTAVSPAGPTTSGAITVRGAGTNGGLLHSYTQSYSAGSTFQVIRVPQTLNATLGNYTAAAWDVDASGYGTGGVFALDVAQQATLSGTINVVGQGFRGGAAFNLTGNTTGLTSSSVAYPAGDHTGGSKGEGTLGTPGYVFDGYAATIKQYGPNGLTNAAYSTAAGTAPSGTNDNGSYASGGSFGFGAMGSAGGGGNDALPGAGGTNQYNSGGAGGGNAGRGGQGGWTWLGNAAYCQNVGYTPTQCPFVTNEGITDGGGRGGAAVGGLSAGLVTLGGGGGAASVNNNNSDANTISTYPPIDVAVDPTSLSGGSTTVSNGADGAISGSGARGGGIVLIRAGTFNAGAGQILADGVRAYNQFGAAASEAAGGGGAGGAIVVLAQAASGTLQASAIGGRGGDPDYYAHGPGGGGGGGYVLTNFSVTGSVSEGGGGYVPNINTGANFPLPNHYGTDAVPGIQGYLSSAGGTTPGTLSGSACTPDVAASVTLPAAAGVGATVNGSFNYVDNGPSDALGVGYGATLPAGLGTVTFGTITLNGVAVAGASATYNNTTGAITYTGLPGTLPNAQTLVVPISFTMPANGTSVTGTDVVSEATTDPVPSNNNGTATVNGTPQADDAVTITGLPASAAPNAAIFGVLNFVNNGPSTSNTVTYTAKLPIGAAVSSIKYNGNTLTGASATVGSDGTVTFTGLPTTLNVNDTVTVAFNASMPSSGASAAATASIAAATTDPNTSNNTASAIVTGQGSADLATTITGVPTSAQAAGSMFTGSVNFQNNGPSTAVTPVYTVQVPPGSTISAAQVLYNGSPINGVTVTIDQYGNVTFGGTGLPTSLANGDHISIGFSSTMPADGSNANVVSSISSPTTDPNTSNNNASATVTGIREADLQSSVTGYATYAQTAGTTETGMITFADNGPSGATDVTYTSSVSGSPTSVTLGTPMLNGVAIAGATATYNTGTGAITYTGLPTTLNPGDKITVSVSFPMPGNPVTVSSNISSNTTDPVPSNNAGSQTLNGGNDLAVALTNWPTAAQTSGTAETSTATYSIVSGSAVAPANYTPVLTLTPGLTGVSITATGGVTATYNAGTGAVTFAGLPTLSRTGTTNFALTINYTMPTTNVVAQASISENPNIDTYAGNNTATATVPGGATMTDVATTITGLGGVAAAGSTVSTGVIKFTNAATAASTGDSFAAKLPVGATVTSITLNGTVIAGASATVGSDGTVTFTGMPTTLATSAVVAVAFSFPMPSDGSAATATATVTSTNDSNAANNTATATETGDAPTDLQTKVTQPASGLPNSTLNGTLDYLNNGPGNAVNPTYQMTLPVAGGTPTITSVMLNGSLLQVTTSIAANGVVTFTGMPATLSSGDDLRVAYTYKTPASGSVSTTGTISYPGTDTVPGNNSATGTTTVTANAPTVMVTKTVDHTTHNAGDSVNWTLTVTNTGTSATTGVITLTDTLPSGIANVVITPSSGTTCSPANPGAGTTLTCSVPAGLAASGGVATVGIAATLPTAGTYNNSVTPSGNASDNPTCAANACSTVTVVGSATMQVFKTSIDGTGTFGYALTNMSATTDSITTTNQNTSTPGVINVVTSLSTPITINEGTSPAGYSLTSASCVDTNAGVTGNTGSFGTLSGTTLTIPVANIKQNSTLQCTFVNTAAVTMSIAKTGPTAMTVGTAANYTLTVTNTSAAATVTTATVTDQLPANFTFNSGSGNGWTCSAVAQLVTCTFAGTIARNGTSTIVINATPSAAATGVINYATIDPTGGTNPAAPSGCTASTTCALSPAANVTATGLSITKSAPSPGLMPNANSTYTLTVTNNGTTPIAAQHVRDQLPSQLTYVSAVGTGWTCTENATTFLITCTSTTSLAGGASSTIAVTVKPTTQAVVGTSVTNYASIDPTGNNAPPTPGASCTPSGSCASQTSTVGGPNVMVTKTVDSTTHAQGDTITWTIRAANTGGAASTAAITLTDTLPAGISNIVATPSAGTTCTPANPTAGGTLTCTVPAGLAASTGVATVSIAATAVATGSITNTVSPSGTDNPTCAAGACSATTMVGGQSLTLQKALTGPRAANSDQFTVQISSGATVLASATTTGSGSSVGNGSTGALAVTAGTAYTLGEVAAGSTNLSNYSAALACSNAATGSTTTLPTAVGGSVTPAAGDRITCTITNSAAPLVTLIKALGTPRVHNTDQFTLQIANGATVVGSATTTGTGSTLATNSTGATALSAGTTYTLNEISSGGTQLAQYTSALACSNSTTGSATVLPTTVPGNLTPAAGDNISCTLNNTAKPPVVTYLATLTGTRAANTDQFTLAIANGATTVDSVTTTGTGGTLSNATTGAQTLVSGSTYTLTEAAAGSTNLAQYTSTLSCTNADATSATTLPTTLPATLVPTVGDNITCTVAIVPKAPTVLLTKALGSNREAANDQFTLQINQGASTLASTTTTGSGNTVANQSVGPTALVSGTTYTLTEVASGGANLMQYTQALACTNTLAGSSTVLPTTVPGNVTPQDGDAISCTLTNTGNALLATAKALTTVNGVAPGASVKDNDVLVYTVTVQNSGASPGSTLVTETVPLGTTYTGTAEGWSASCTTGGTTCSQTITAAASASASKTFTVTVVAGVTATSISNTVTSSNGSCGAGCTVTTPVAPATLATTKTLFSVNGAAPGATVKAGDVLLYHIAVQNSGGSTGTTSLGETVPAGTSYSGTGEGWGTGCTTAGTTCTQSVTVNGGATVTENYTVTVATPTTTTSVANSVTSSVGTCGAACTVTSTVASADVQTTVSYTTTPVNAGSSATANIVFTNAGPSTAAGVTYGATLTTGLSNVTFPTLPTGVSAAYNAGTGAVTFTGLPATLTSGQSENISISYTQPGSATSSVTTTIATTTHDPNTSNNTATATVTGAMEADVTTTAAYTSGSVAGGATATLNLAFLNNGPSSAVGVTYTTTLTTGLTNVLFPSLPTGVSAAYNATTGAVTFTGLPTTLTAAQTENIQITYTQPASGTSSVNTAIATTSAETNTTNNTATATTAGTAEADVTTSAAYTSGSVAGGATATLNLSFSNNGPGSAAGVTYTTTLTTGLTNVVFTALPTGVSAAYNPGSGVVTYTGLPTTLTSGQAENIQITYTQPPAGTSTVNTAIATTTTETNTTNDTATATTTGTAEADVTTTAAYTSGTVAGGATATLNLSFSNNGPGAAAGVTYTTTLTTGLTNVLFPSLPTGVSAAYNATTGAVTFTGLPTTLAAAQAENIQITYTQPASGTSSVNTAIATTSAESNSANNTAAATTTGTGEADVTTTAAYTSGTVAGGATATLNLSFSNNGPGSAAGVTYTTTLTTGLTNVVFTALPTGVSAAYNATSGVVTYTGLPTTLTSGQTENVQITYTQPATGTSTVNSAISTTTTETNTTNNTATATTAGAGEADVTTTANYTSGTVAGGATATLNLSFLNNGPATAAGVTTTTTLTTGLTNVLFPVLPTGVSAAYNPATGAVTFTGLPTSLAAAQTENIQITYTQPASGTSSVNTAIATTTTESNSANNNATATTTGTAEADVTTTAAYTSGTVAGGATATLNLGFSNNGPGAAQGVTYSTTLTAGLANVTFPTLPTGVSAAYNATSGVVTFTGLPTTLTSGQTENIQIAYTQPASGTSSVNSAVTTTTQETNTANNSATASTTGSAEADVATSDTYTSANVNAGSPATVNVVFTNNGPGSAAGVTYTTTLTTGLSSVTFPTLPTGVTGAYNATTGAVTFTGLPTTLAQGQTENISISYPQPATGTSGITTVIGTTTTESNTANDSASASTTGTGEADVTTTATYTTGSVNAGSIATVNVVFKNNGPVSAAGVSTTTTLTAGLANVTFPTLPTGVTAAYNPASGAVTFTGLPATLSAGQTENISISYTQPGTATSSINTSIATTTAETNTTNNAASATITGTMEADVTTTAVYTSGTVAGGATATLNLSFLNNGPSAANGVATTTTLTPGLANVQFPTLPSGVTAAYNPATGAVTFTGLPTTLAAAQSENIQITYTQPASGTSTVNTAIATSTAETNTTNNTATASTTGAAEADVATTVNYTTGSVNAGATATVNVVFTNNGPGSAAAVTYTTTLTTGLTGVTFPTLPTGVTAAYNPATGAVTFTGLPTTLTSGQTENISISYTQPAAPSSGISTAITTSTTQTNTGNDTASASVSGVPEADVATTSTFPSTINAGSPVSGTITFTNNGPSPAAGVTYTTTLTAGLANVTFPTLPTGVTAIYNPANGVVTYTGLPTALPSGTTETIGISYTQPPSGSSSVNPTIATTTADPNSANNTATSNIGGVPEADVATTSSFPNTVNAGNPVTGSITFTNNGPSPAAGVTYTTTLTAGLANVTFPTLPTGVTAVYNPTNGVVTYTGLPTTLPSGTTETIGISYTQPPSGSSSVNPVIATTTADPNTGNNSATSIIGGAMEADVATSVSYSPTTVNAGASATATVTFSNNGPSPAAGVTYTTTLTAGLANVTFPTLPTGVSAAYNPANGQVSYTGLPTTLASGASQTIAISYPQPAAATSSINTTIATTTADPNVANNAANASVSGVAEADLQTTTTFPASANPAVNVSGTVVFTNNGPSPAAGVVYTTTLSAGLANVTFPTLPTGVAAAYNATTGAVTYTGLPTTLASGASQTIGISYTQPASGASSTVQGTISASTADPVPGNNSATSPVTGNAQADLATTLTAPGTVNAGQTVNGTVAFTNNGPSSATAVSYTLSLPAGLTSVTFSNLPNGVTANYNPATGAVSFTGLPTTLTSGQSVAPIGFSYAQPAGGTSTVTSSISSATTDPTPGNNTATANIAGVAEADTSVVLTLPANVNAGSTVTGSVAFANAGPSSANAVTYTLTLSSGLANVAFSTLPTGVTATYNPATGVVTFTGLPVTLTSGQTIPNIGISYTQPASGTSTASASIASTTADPNSANNSANATVNGNPEADLSTVLNFPANVNGLQPVSGTVTFANAGPSIANAVTYALTLSPGLANVSFANLPTGVTAVYNVGTGAVTLTGMPTVLGVNQSVGPITINYTQPASGTSSVTGVISSSTADPNPANNTASANVVGTAVNADLAIQTSAPATVAPDGSLIYTLTITNNGPGAANNATFSDTLPSVLGVPTASCAPASAGVTCGTTTVAGKTVSGTLTSLPAGGTAVVTISTTAPASGTFTDTATVATPTGITDPVPANNTSSATTTVGAVPNNVDLSVTTSGTTSVQPNGTVTYIVDVVNGGPSAANNAVFNYSTAAPVSNVTWTCVAVGGGAVCPAASGTGNTISQTIATFPDGGHLEYTITGKAPAAPQQFVDTATITAPAGVTETNLANNTATTTTNVQAAAAPSADVATTINGPSTVQPGAAVVYTVVVTNNGPSPANGTTLSVPVAAQVSNVTTTCVATGGAVCPTVAAGNNISSIIPTLPNGGELVFTVTGTAPQSGTFDTSATVTPPTGTNDPVPSNNTAGPVVTTVPVLSADLSIQKNGPAQVLAGGVINYTIIVSNAGPNAGDGATVTDVLPAGLTNASVVCSAATGGAACGTAAITGGTLHAVAGALPAAGSITLTVSATAPASGTLSNSASVAPPAGVTDPNTGNNNAGPVVTNIVASVPTQADLSASITGPSIVAPNGTVTYVVTITNAGPAAGNNAPISDVLPAVLTNISAVCGNTVGGATCGAVAVNGKTVSSTIGALPVGASLTLTITATAPASGTFSNSASVGAAPGETDPNTANNVAGPVVTTIGVASGIANLGISKTGPDMAGAGSSFSYTLLVSNAGPAAANGALVSDAVPAGLTNIHATCSAPTNGAVCGPVQVAGQNVTSAVQSLPALGTVTITVTVTAPVPSGLQPTTVVNRATITPPSGINDPDTSDNVSNAVETAIVSAGVSGTVWLDINHDKKLDAGDPLLPNWIVELFHNGVLVATTTTNAQGQYAFTGVPPGPGYSIDFRDPGSKAVYGTPTNGNEGVPNPDSNAVIGNGIIESLTLKPGINIVQQSLPVDPSGVVYDATVRTPIGGATVTLVGPAGFNPATELVGGAGNAKQVTESSGPTAGAYQFLLINPGQPGGAPAGTYTIVVTPPAGYLPTPAKTGGVSQPGASFSVPGPISATTAIQPQEGPPKVGDNGAGTIYYFNLVFNNGSGAVINNNVPLDRISGGALTVQKTGSTATADIGETVLYTVDVTSSVGVLPKVALTDRLPRGFTLVPGTTTINGVKAADPKGNNEGVLTFELGSIPASVTVEIKYRVRIGVGAQQGDGINRAQASNPLGATSNVATFKVDVNGGVFTTNACVVGKVFIDCNGNLIQDENEIGIPGVRLYFSDGTFVVTDSEGKYSYCGLRPTTHTLKVDKTTLPPGSRLVESSNRNALDPNSLFIDLKNGELHQADFIEGSCSPQVMEETKARRGQGEVNAAQPSQKAGPALIFDSKPLNMSTPAAKPAPGAAP